MKCFDNIIKTDYGLSQAIILLEKLIKSFTGAENEKVEVKNILINILQYTGRKCPCMLKDNLWIDDINNEDVLLAVLIKFKKWKDFIEDYEAWLQELNHFVRKRLLAKKMTIYELSSIAEIQPSVVLNILKGKDEISVKIISALHTLLEIEFELLNPPKFSDGDDGDEISIGKYLSEKTDDIIC